MTELRQREPRIRNDGYLKWLRQQGCCCGCKSLPPSDPAHIRTGCAIYGKRHVGMQEKPDDQWSLPLKRAHHAAQHAFGDELGWFTAHGINPFQRALRYYGAYVAQMDTGGPRKARGEPAAKKPRKVKPTKKSYRAKPKGRGWPAQQRKLTNRGFI